MTLPLLPECQHLLCDGEHLPEQCDEWATECPNCGACDHCADHLDSHECEADADDDGIPFQSAGSKADPEFERGLR